MQDNKKYFQFIGFKGNFTHVPQFHYVFKDGLIYMPSIFMFLFFSKGVFIWIMNTIIVISIFEVFGNPNEKEETKSELIETVRN